MKTCDWSIVCADPNVFIHMMTKEFFGISVQYSLLAFHVVVLVVAISKLYHFVALFGPEISIPQVCLFMEILQILRMCLPEKQWFLLTEIHSQNSLVSWSLDGTWNMELAYSIHSLVLVNSVYFLLNVPHCFLLYVGRQLSVLTSTGAEITSQYKPVSDSAPNLRRMRWPFAVSMCILWGYQLLVIVTYTALPQLLVIVFIRDIILVIFSVFGTKFLVVVSNLLSTVGFIFLIYGFRVIKILHRFQNRHNAMQKVIFLNVSPTMLVQMTVLVVGLGSVNLVTCLLALSLALPCMFVCHTLFFDFFICSAVVRYFLVCDSVYTYQNCSSHSKNLSHYSLVNSSTQMTWMIVMLLEPSRAQYSQKIRSSMLGCCSTRMMLLDTSTTESGKRELSSSLISFHHSSSVDHVWPPVNVNFKHIFPCFQVVSWKHTNKKNAAAD